MVDRRRLTRALATHPCPDHGKYQASEARDGTQAHRGGDYAKRSRRLLTSDADKRCRHRAEDELAETLQGGRGTGQVRIVGQRQSVRRREDQPTALTITESAPMSAASGGSTITGQAMTLLRAD